MTRLQRELEGSAGDLIDLTFGYPDGLQQPWMRALVRIPTRRLQTSNARQLKHEIASWFAGHYSTSDARVLLTNTACEALAVAIGCMVKQADDEIILFDGCFDPYPPLIQSFKGRPVFAPRFADGKGDLDSLQRLLTPRTRAVLVTHPDNPLGHVYSKDELEMLADFCDAAGLTLIVDSAFAFVSPYGVDTFGPLQAARNADRWILVGDTGKIFDLFGVRCGALIASDGLGELLQARLDQLFFRMDALRLNVLASIVRDARAARAARYVNDTIAANFRYLARHIHPRLRPIRPMAGSLAILQFDAAQTTDAEVAATLRRSAGVATVPCSYFVFADACGGSLHNRLRIALARPPGIIRRAVDKLNAALDRPAGGLSGRDAPSDVLAR
jgi:methionine aminotransferase